MTDTRVVIVLGLTFVTGIIGSVLFLPALFLTVPGFLLLYYEVRLSGHRTWSKIACDLTILVLCGLFWLSFDNMLLGFGSLLGPVELSPMVWLGRMAVVIVVTFISGIPITRICGPRALGETKISTADPERVYLVPEEDFRREQQLIRETITTEHHLTRKTKTRLDSEARRAWTMCDNCGRNLDEDDIEKMRVGLSATCSCGHVNIRGASVLSKKEKL